MSDTPERPVEYKPEEGAEVRPAPRYSIAPAGFETLPHDTATTYQSLSVLAVVAFVLAAVYSFVVTIGGIAAFWANYGWVLLIGTILVPLLAIPVALKFNIRDRLALARIAGLALVAFYAVPVGIGGLFAFPSQSPWLLPLWTLLFPLAAIGVAVAARLRIQGSEGTLSGNALTTWAILLSLFFALCYTAFYSATYVAVRYQAVTFTGDWIDRLQKDDLERAFAMTIEPQYRNKSSDSLSRDEIESFSLRQRGEDGRGAYSAFEERPAVRLLHGGDKSNVELVEVKDWGYESGGYKVFLKYQITTPYWSFPLEITVFGTESPKGDWKGRRWVLQSQASNLTRINPTFTAKGTQLLKLAPSGEEFAERWPKKLWDNPVLALNDSLPGGAFAAPAAAGLGLRAQQVQAPFFKGAMVKSDEKTFWVPERPNIRDQLVSQVKNLFVPGREIPEHLTLPPTTPRSPMPLWSEQNGRLLFSYDVDIRVPIQIIAPTLPGALEPAKSESGTATVEAHIIVSCPSSVLESGNPEWRFESLELIRGQRLDPNAPAGPRRPGPPRPAKECEGHPDRRFTRFWVAEPHGRSRSPPSAETSRAAGPRPQGRSPAGVTNPSSLPPRCVPPPARSAARTPPDAADNAARHNRVGSRPERCRTAPAAPVPRRCAAPHNTPAPANAVAAGADTALASIVFATMLPPRSPPHRTAVGLPRRGRRTRR